MDKIRLYNKCANRIGDITFLKSVEGGIAQAKVAGCEICGKIAYTDLYKYVKLRGESDEGLYE